MMNSEGCRERGHLAINQIVVQQLYELHSQLLKSSKFPFYNTEYYRVLPYIVELRQRSNNQDSLQTDPDLEINEIETCLTALYGVMMLKLQKKEISQNTEHAVKEITTFIGMLSDYYQKDKEEGLQFE